MLKRATWLSVGFGLGVGTTVTAAYKIRKRIERYRPLVVGERIAQAAQSMRDALAAAVAEGREAMTERESELRGRFLRG
jgi:hypothetical protein